MPPLGILIAQTLGSELAVLAIFFTGSIPSQKLTFMLSGFDESLQSTTIGTIIFDWTTGRDCGAGVYLCWHHSHEEAEGSFAIEKTFYETGGTRHWEYYRSRIPLDQRYLFVPISDFLSNNVNFRIRYSREMPPDPEKIEGEEIDEIRRAVPEDFFFSLIDEDTTCSLYSNIVSMISHPPPVLLRIFREFRIYGNPITLNWTPIEIVDNYQFEVSDDPTSKNRERMIRTHLKKSSISVATNRHVTN